jgi:isopentenyl diphosphate isomerase/L-lactate dehydrogenase-like FMN-dependent dehydrogenase
MPGMDRTERDRRYQEGELPWPVSPEEWELAAADAMVAREFDYVAGGAGGEATVRANREAFARRQLRPRMLTGNLERSLSVPLPGFTAPVPVLTAPVGVLEMAHPEAEIALARAVKELGVPLVLSNQASTPMEEIAAELDGHPAWFQLYWNTDREVVQSLVSRARAAGYSAIVLTVDTNTQGWRERDLRNQFSPFFAGRGIAQYTSDPVFRSRLEKPPEEDPVAAGLEMIRTFPNPGLGWEDLAWLREQTSLPILLKGVLRGDDAQRAADAGVAGLIVSNHGGRQLDGSIASLDAVAEVRAAFGDGAVLMDGGVRRGADVLKALALGADAVLVGRPFVYGLAVAGRAGVVQALHSLLADLDIALTTAGAADVRAVASDLVA